mmetsp:Transcript_73672/g.204869  ORF Transcript_73672/g.204869 Transcript_73672/m.204869 type:complete len:241 (+) Transcript_73672:1827-2549(+)
MLQLPWSDSASSSPCLQRAKNCARAPARRHDFRIGRAMAHLLDRATSAQRDRRHRRKDLAPAPSKMQPQIVESRQRWPSCVADLSATPRRQRRENRPVVETLAACSRLTPRTQSARSRGWKLAVHQAGGKRKVGPRRFEMRSAWAWPRCFWRRAMLHPCWPCVCRWACRSAWRSACPSPRLLHAPRWSGRCPLTNAPFLAAPLQHRRRCRRPRRRARPDTRGRFRRHQSRKEGGCGHAEK